MIGLKGGLASVGHFIRRNEQLYFDELLNFFNIFSKINIVGLHHLCYTTNCTHNILKGKNFSCPVFSTLAPGTSATDCNGGWSSARIPRCGETVLADWWFRAAWHATRQVVENNTVLKNGFAKPTCLFTGRRYGATCPRCARPTRWSWWPRPRSTAPTTGS